MSSREVSCHSSPSQDNVIHFQPLELIHMNLFGLTSYKSIDGNLYYQVIVDDYSRYTWTLFLGDKSKTVEIFKTFTRRAQQEYNSPIVKTRSDNRSEFKNMNIKDWCDKEGVKHEFSTTYTS
jgi:transposase InsO family protein